MERNPESLVQPGHEKHNYKSHLYFKYSNSHISKKKQQVGEINRNDTFLFTPIYPKIVSSMCNQYNYYY